jgi:riboflavin kinase/FMN adenylyltransferase
MDVFPDDKVIHGLEALPAEARDGVLSIGNFDGVHRGHRALLAKARELADAEGLQVTAMTFDPPPDLVLRPQDPPKQLTDIRRRAQLLLEAGADRVLRVRPTRELLCKSPEAFIEEVIVGRFRPRHLVEGPNFFFGAGRAGTVDTLRQAGRERGFFLHVVEPEGIDLPEGRERISSTLIRRLLSCGRVEDAAQCLARPYSVCGPVVHGAGWGRRLGAATMNLDTGDQLLPADGVYAGRVRCEGREWAAAASIGTKPTFEDDQRSVEAHLLDADGDFYGRQAELMLLNYLRPQRRFEDPQALREQIQEDIRRVRTLRP